MPGAALNAIAMPRAGSTSARPLANGSAAARERILPRRVENDDLHAAGKRRKRLGEIRNANGLQRHVDVALDIGVDRHEIILALELQAIAGEIDQRDCIGSRGRDLAEEFAKRFPQRRLIEVPRAGDRESRGAAARRRRDRRRWRASRACRSGIRSLPMTSAKRISARMAGALTERQNDDDDEPQNNARDEFAHRESPYRRSVARSLVGAIDADQWV